MVKKLTTIFILCLEISLLFPTQSLADELIPNILKTAPSSAFPGDTVTIKLGPIKPGNIKGIADMVLTMDVSRSMKDPLSGVSCSLGTDCKIDLARNAFLSAVDTLSGNSVYNKEAFVTFYGDKNDPVAPSAWKTQVTLSADPVPLKAAINKVNTAAIPLGACTSIGGGVYQALNELKARARGIVPEYIILATDGLQNMYPSVYDHYPTASDPTIIDQAKSQGIKVFTVGIGIKPNDVREFNSCETHDNSAGPGLKGPFNPTGKYSDLNGNGILDGEDYLMDLANQTSGTYKLVTTGAEFTNDLVTIINSIQFPFSFEINDVIDSDIFEPITDLNNVKLTNCNNSTEIIAGTTKSRIPSPPLLAAYVPWSFRINTVPVPVDQFRCVEIKARVKSPFLLTYQKYFVDSDTKAGGELDPSDPGYWDIVFPYIPGLTIVNKIKIDNQQIDIQNPSPAWLQTTKGDVGSKGGFKLDRTSPPASISQFLGLYKGALSNFTSAKTWLLQRAVTDSISLGNVSNYGQLVGLAPTTCPKTIPIPPSSLPSGRGKFSFPASTSVVWNGAMDSADCPGFNENTTVIFINGNLTINNNFPSAGTNPAVIIVKGDININSSVTSLRGVFIADGVIRTGLGASQLTVNGSLIGSLGVFLAVPLLQRDLGNNCSSNCNLNNPAEIINFEPKYLYYFRNTLGVTKNTFKEERP